jgi:hypothetical protein
LYSQNDAKDSNNFLNIPILGTQTEDVQGGGGITGESFIWQRREDRRKEYLHPIRGGKLSNQVFFIDIDKN